MAAVAARAGTLRAHRRRTTLAAAAAVAVVVVTPAAVWLDRSSGSTSGPSTAPSSTSASPTVSTSTPPKTSLADLPSGRAPGIDYLRGSDYVTADGHTTTLPLAKVTDATPYRGGFLVQHTGGDLGPRLTWLDNELHPQWTTCGNGLVLSGDHTLLAYVTDDCTSDVAKVHLAIPSGMSDSEQTADVSGLPVSDLGIARGSVVYSRLPGHGVYVTDFSGPDRRVPGLSYGGAVDPTGTYVAGQSSGDDRTGELVDLATGAVAWRHPGYLMHFSPDGRYLLAGTTADQNAFQVLDAATGREVGAVTAPSGLVVEAVAWDGDTVLALLSDSQTDSPRHEAIARFDLHGDGPTLATPVIRVAASGTGYAFAATS
jgi:hypothetical protein